MNAITWIKQNITAKCVAPIWKRRKLSILQRHPIFSDDCALQSDWSLVVGGVCRHNGKNGATKSGSSKTWSGVQQRGGIHGGENDDHWPCHDQRSTLAGHSTSSRFSFIASRRNLVIIWGKHRVRHHNTGDISMIRSPLFASTLTKGHFEVIRDHVSSEFTNKC